MLKIENHCVDCGQPCIGGACRYKDVPVYYCDKCNEELDDVYEVDGEDLCESCLKDMFKKQN